MKSQRKLSMLQLAQELGNVSKACKVMGYTRSQFYEIKRAFQTGGLDALLDKPTVPGSTPHKVPEETEKKVIDLSIEHPAWGQQRIADELMLRGAVISHGTVRNIQLRHNLENRYKRMLELEKRTAVKSFKLTQEQVRLLEKLNPEFAERHVESLYPGYLLCQDTFYVGTLKGVGRLYMQAAVDTFCSLAFAKIYTAKIAMTAADLLDKRVLPFYETEGLRSVSTILRHMPEKFREEPPPLRAPSRAC